MQPGNPTVGVLLDEAGEQLRRAGVPNPGRDARTLLGDLLGVQPDLLFARRDQPVVPALAETFRGLVARRERREPVPYILGWREFWSLRFVVNRSVLVPRPETEGIIEEALRLPLPARPRVADVGTGSGILAIVLAREIPGAEVFATDVSADALAVAGENARRHGVAHRLRFLPGPDLEPLLREGLAGSIDLLVSNPPYVPGREIEGLAPEVRDWEPRGALVPGESGTEFYERVLPGLAGVLAPGGWVLLEIGAGQERAVSEGMAASGLPVEFRPDLQGLPRVARARRLESAGRSE